MDNKRNEYFSRDEEPLYHVCEGPNATNNLQHPRTVVLHKLDQFVHFFKESQQEVCSKEASWIRGEQSPQI